MTINTTGGLSRRTALKGGVVLALTSHTPAVAKSVTVTNLPPQQRIDTAIEEIKAALAEMHPNWRMQAQDHVLRYKMYQPGSFYDGDAYRHTILISTGEERHGPQDVRYFTVDLPEVRS
jgi:hypothetical protein